MGDAKPARIFYQLVKISISPPHLGAASVRRVEHGMLKSGKTSAAALTRPNRQKTLIQNNKMPFLQYILTVASAQQHSRKQACSVSVHILATGPKPFAPRRKRA
jgi:hypothetical protein